MVPEKVVRIVEKILKDLNSRSGFDMAGLDQEIQDEIKETWINIVMEEL